MSTHERPMDTRETKALLHEFRALSKRARDVHDDLLDDVALSHGTNLRCWRIKLSKFGTSVDGQMIERDLRELQRRHGVGGHITLEVMFRDTFPTHAPFCRVVSPRMRWYSGHVTGSSRAVFQMFFVLTDVAAGGSICLRSLVNGIHGGWDPNYTIEGIIEMIKFNFIYAERVFVSTATGPGGMAGPLRVDLDNEFSFNVTQEYSLWAAESAFHRALENHRRNGW